MKSPGNEALERVRWSVWMGVFSYMYVRKESEWCLLTTDIKAVTDKRFKTFVKRESSLVNLLILFFNARVGGIL